MNRKQYRYKLLTHNNMNLLLSRYSVLNNNVAFNWLDKFDQVKGCPDKEKRCKLQAVTRLMSG